MTRSTFAPRRSTFIALGLRAAALLAALAPLAGCAQLSPNPAHALVRGERAIVSVEGQGTVTSFPDRIECGAKADESDCRGEWEEVMAPSLTANPAKGWEFDHWEVVATNVSLATGKASTHHYTAVFRKADTTLAAR